MISAQDREIQALVSDVRDGKLLLPEMQRGYVWKSTQVRDLFDSLYRNYPSGQLLIWETDDLPHLRATSLDGAERQGRSPQLLLDGQQRLTSLTAVMLGMPLQVRDANRPIDIVFNLSTEKFEVASPKHGGENSRWISLTKLYSQGPMSVLMEVKLDPADPESALIFDRIKRLDNIKHYKYRVIVLEKLSYEEVTHIFVRINSGGTKLSTADLALAQISSRWHGVSEELGSYLDTLRRRGLEMDAGMLLRAMALFLNGQSSLSQFFRNERRIITVDELKAVWARVRTAMDRAVAFLTGNCKIDQLSLLPTNYVLVPLAAFFDKFGEKVSPTQARDLQRWVYMALLWNRYSLASETALEQDVGALSREHPVRGMIQNLEDKIGQRRLLNERDLQGQRKNSAAMLMTYVLLRHHGAADWFSGVMLDGTQVVEIHPIFSRSALRGKLDAKQEALTVEVANLAFFLNGAGTRLGKRSPEKYLPEVDASRLRAQSVPTTSELWSPDRFEQFLLQRRQALADGINRLLASLSDDPSLWPTNDVQVLETRVDAIEHGMRELIADRLEKEWGEKAWDQCIPKDVQKYITDRVEKRLQAHPYEKGQHDSLEARLRFCQFSDYPRIFRGSWGLFEDVFGKVANQAIFDQHMRAVTAARNNLKHNNELNRSELASAEAGLVWFEECLHRFELARVTVDDAEDEDKAVAAETTS